MSTIDPPPRDYTVFFTQWIARLHTSLQEQIPTLDEGMVQVFSSACCTVQEANETRLEAIKALKQEKHENESESDDNMTIKKTKAQSLVEQATKAQAQALDTLQALANTSPSLLPALNDTLSSSSFDDTDLVVYTVLCSATVPVLAAWCQDSPTQAQELLHTLQNDIPLLRSFMAAGGPRHGQIGRAVSLYHKLTKPNSSPVVQRLAMACALEHADPHPLFDKRQGFVDPVQRYIHYEQAYLAGELDAQFATFTVWELRQVVNSDATDGELGWGRQCLLAYRPDIAVWPVEQWKYCEIVKTDVAYKTPEWYKDPRTYDQILSGGGKCGPRAWYGRFICKAFGIPTWGVQQPGHAAMTRYTSDQGWVVCLGGGMWKSWWEDQGGLDFLLDTQARTACGRTDEHVFAQKVLRMQWVGEYLYKENVASIRRNGIPDGNAPWYSLAMMQRMILAAKQKKTTSSDTTLPLSFDCCVDARVHQIQQYKLAQTKLIESTVVTPSSSIIIPASTCCDPTKDTKKIMFLPSYQGGGKQLFVKEDGQVTFCFTSCLDEGDYTITLLVSTAHRSEGPVTVCTTTDDHTYTLEMPYTMGLWAETKPLRIHLTKECTGLKICRPKQPFGFSFKQITLTPVSGGKEN